MARKKKKESWLQLQTDWMFQEPIDFEHKKYILLDFLKKCDDHLNNFKVYPTFIELSLHLANTQTLIKGENILYTEKELKSPDDEIMLMDLKYKSKPDLTQESIDEVEKIIKYSAPKFFDYFNLAKSIWTVGFDSVNLTFLKNRRNIKSQKGFVLYKDNFNNIDYVWEFLLKKIKIDSNDMKIFFHPIYSGQSGQLNLDQITNNYSQIFSKMDETQISKLPIVEVTTNQNFPFNETLVPIFKRKLMSNLMQTIKFKSTNINN